MEKYFKEHLNWLKDQGHYNPHLERDRLPLISSLVSMNVTNPLLWALKGHSTPRTSVAHKKALYEPTLE